MKYPLFASLTLLGTLTTITLSAAGAVPQKSPVSDIRVFVFTAGPDEGELVNSETVARHKRAQNAVKVLARELRKKLTVVDLKDKADVTVEVLARGDVPAGIPTPDRDTTKQPPNTIEVTLSSGDYKTDLAGHGTRTAAAEDVASQVEDWISKNHDRLVRERLKTDRK